MGQRIDLMGQRFGSLVVLEFAGLDKGNNGALWVCQCDCKVETRVVVHGHKLRSGHTTSCGCRKTINRTQRVHTTHGDTVGGETKEYRAWISMKNRCTNPKCRFWKRYGGRGIKVCDKWLYSFENFLADVGRAPGPGRGWSIDRMDNDGNYEPGNVKWATRKEQRQNQSRNKERMAA